MAAHEHAAPRDVMLLALTPGSGVSCVEVAQEAILVEESAGRAYPLNASAALVWACLDGEATLQEICADLSEVLVVPLEQVQDDVAAIARRFLDAGLATAPGHEVDRSGTEPTGPGCCGPPLPTEEVLVGADGLADVPWIPEPPNP